MSVTRWIADQATRPDRHRSTLGGDFAALRGSQGFGPVVIRQPSAANRLFWLIGDPAITLDQHPYPIPPES